MNGMSYRQLGNSNIRISPLGLGCWQFSKGNGLVGRYWSVMEQKDINEIIRVSLKGGINWFDTAEAYGKGKSEEALAEALIELGEAGDEALIATKWWPLFRTASSLPRTIDQRLKHLKGKPIDLYQIHQPLSFSGIDQQMEKMAKLLDDGKIRTAGVSNFNAAQMSKAAAAIQERGHSIVSNQVKYSLLDRRIERNGIMDAAKNLGITIIAYSPLEQGILSGKFHKDPEKLKQLSGPRKHFSSFKKKSLLRTKPLIDLLETYALEYEVKPSQIALNWLIHFHGDTVAAIPGASKVRHAEENIGAMSFTLTANHMKEIDRVSKEVSG
ncbi:aldo/keto reductase [Bacillus sp. FJAT-42376]|uniref:aldo/keto reductase n=1 Tax=Bacillus sp. FJAT-42376 TaxID=2014076 RepID=UPI000F514D6C|nr:aldo/keto reductase [Bacillus sp. FJAT-42376]AZB42662.1 aldo/keto reductase [Bacillus sp. FJAT-42376]